MVFVSPPPPSPETESSPPPIQSLCLNPDSGFVLHLQETCPVPLYNFYSLYHPTKLPNANCNPTETPRYSDYLNSIPNHPPSPPSPPIPLKTSRLQPSIASALLNLIHKIIYRLLFSIPNPVRWNIMYSVIFNTYSFPLCNTNRC